MREENEQDIKDRERRRAVRMALYEIVKRVAAGERVGTDEARLAIEMAQGETNE